MAHAHTHTYTKNIFMVVVTALFLYRDDSRSRVPIHAESTLCHTQYSSGWLTVALAVATVCTAIALTDRHFAGTKSHAWLHIPRKQQQIGMLI